MRINSCVRAVSTFIKSHQADMVPDTSTLIAVKLQTGFFQTALALFTIIAATLFISCEKEETGHEKEGYAKGAFISCEGSFNAGNGSVSWYDPDSSEIVNNLFAMVNGRPAGDVVQSFSVAGDYGVIVANNSQKIEVVDLETFESVSTITGFSYPRYFVYSGDGSGYLSNGSLEGQVYRIDLAGRKVTDTIEVGHGPERMVISGNNLFVANSGGWGYDNTVSVIDIQTNKLTETVTVGDIPVDMVVDRDGNIWVLCRGKVVYNESWTEIIDETDSRLVKINTDDLTKDREVVIGQKGDHFKPFWLTADPGGDKLYFGEVQGLYEMGIDEQKPPSEPLINKIFSMAGVNPRSGMIYALEITDYSSPGLLHLYDNGIHTASKETGIAPGGLSFAEQY